ncbi:MAG: NADP-dependent phosphogluconate dehydrogenase [Anaerolineae bacterium]|nr:NADP-dependent phosphogluconate dehydrogenase [Anaerolineae bacterium]
MTNADIGLIGLAVMGQNLVLNMERNGFTVAVYNRTTAVTNDFIAGAGAGKNLIAASTLTELVQALKRPRRVMLMIKAGAPVDQVIDDLKELLEPGDILIDGGNSYYQDTERRMAALVPQGIHYFGVGISGGEEGALWGPSIMPGGAAESYEHIQPIFESIAARVDDEPCVTYIGPGGAGHYVKMVHNGIEYGDMQLIAEAYDLLHRGLGIPSQELSRVFANWNQGALDSYLIEITAKILATNDPLTGQPLVDVILDEAGQKGTGRWTSQDALDLGVPIPTIDAAVDARAMSANKAGRVAAASQFSYQPERYPGDQEQFIDYVGQALYASKICSYAQGMNLLRTASQNFNYQLTYAEIARIWRGGCIIRAAFLNDIRKVFQADHDLPNLLLAPFFRDAIQQRQGAWRAVIQSAIELGIPTPAMSASLAYFDSMRSARLPANLIQAQRDFFGAHTYMRNDREGTFHTEWEPENS